MNTIRGTVDLLGTDRTDGWVEMILAVIERARRDAVHPTACGADERAHWQNTAIEFLSEIDQLRAEIERRH